MFGIQEYLRARFRVYAKMSDGRNTTDYCKIKFCGNIGSGNFKNPLSITTGQ